MLATEDGGKTWLSRSIGKETILQASFSDAQHGIIRTPSSLLFTADGGLHLSVVSDSKNIDDIKHFPYPLPFHGEFELLIMIESVTEEMHGSN